MGHIEKMAVLSDESEKYMKKYLRHHVRSGILLGVMAMGAFILCFDEWRISVPLFLVMILCAYLEECSIKATIKSINSVVDNSYRSGREDEHKAIDLDRAVWEHINNCCNNQEAQGGECSGTNIGEIAAALGQHPAAVASALERLEGRRLVKAASEESADGSEQD